MAPHLFVSFCGASFFVGSDFFRAKSRDPHVPLALCKKEASRYKGTGKAASTCSDPQTRVREDKSEQSTVLTHSSPAEGSMEYRESHVVPPRF